MSNNKNTKKVKKGIYQHYKGNFYEVLGVARNSENLEEMVVYKALYSNSEKAVKLGDLFVRPKSLFIGIVISEGKQVHRFKYVGKKMPKSKHSKK